MRVESPENRSNCGYCGFSDNKIEHLECIACGHTPWRAYIKYPDHSSNFSQYLSRSIKFLEINDLNTDDGDDTET